MLKMQLIIILSTTAIFRITIQINIFKSSNMQKTPGLYVGMPFCFDVRDRRKINRTNSRRQMQYWILRNSST